MASRENGQGEAVIALLTPAVSTTPRNSTGTYKMHCLFPLSTSPFSFFFFLSLGHPRPSSFSPLQDCVFEGCRMPVQLQSDEADYDVWRKYMYWVPCQYSLACVFGKLLPSELITQCTTVYTSITQCTSITWRTTVSYSVLGTVYFYHTVYYSVLLSHLQTVYFYHIVYYSVLLSHSVLQYTSIMLTYSVRTWLYPVYVCIQSTHLQL